MSEKWVREWRGWEAARSELLAAQDMEDQRRAVEDRTVMFMLLLMEALVFDRPRGGPCVRLFQRWLKQKSG